MSVENKNYLVTKGKKLDKSINISMSYHTIFDSTYIMNMAKVGNTREILTIFLFPKNLISVDVTQ